MFGLFSWGEANCELHKRILIFLSTDSSRTSSLVGKPSQTVPPDGNGASLSKINSDTRLRKNNNNNNDKNIKRIRLQELQSTRELLKAKNANQNESSYQRGSGDTLPWRGETGGCKPLAFPVQCFFLGFLPLAPSLLRSSKHCCVISSFISLLPSAPNSPGTQPLSSPTWLPCANLKFRWSGNSWTTMPHIHRHSTVYLAVTRENDYKDLLGKNFS